MSPEQATAERELDPRTDIYALAAVVYEMLIGEPPFTGPTTQSVIARVLTESPRSVRVGRPTVPEHIDAAVQKALAKLPADRFRTAVAFTEALERPTLANSNAFDATAASQRTVPRVQLLVAGAVTLAAIAFGASGWLRTPVASEAPVVRSAIRLPSGGHAESRQSGSPLALSPDGTVLVYAGTRQLFVRRLDQSDVIPIPNTLGAEQPFFSPDGRNVGFVADGSLKRVPLAGGPVVTICSARQIQGATWGPGDVIVFAAGGGNATGGLGGALYAVSANGGAPRPVVADSTGETLFRWPDFLPDGQHVLASLGTALAYRSAVVNLKTGKFELVPRAASSPRYVEPGWLLSVALDGTVTAIPFDAGAGRATGDPIPVLDGVATGLGGVAKFAVSRNGWIVYAEGAPRERRLTLVDRRGVPTTVPIQAQSFNDPRFSPTGTDVVVTVLRAGGGLLGDIWIVNVQRATMSRLTFEGTDQFPDWSADGRHVTYTTLRPNNGVNWKATGGGPADSLLKLPGRTIFDAVLTHDARRVVYRLGGIPGDLHYVSRDSLGASHTLLDSRFDERAAALSTDDHWLAYVSDETGRDEVYVRPFPDAGGRWVISAAGGGEPRWSRDGKELFYRNADTLFAVQVETRPTFSVGRRSTLFTGSYLRNPRHATYDVHPDGQHFIFITGDTDDSGELVLVQNAMVAATRGRPAQP
jgi:serine/threonine-protein kinase